MAHRIESIRAFALAAAYLATIACTHLSPLLVEDDQGVAVAVPQLQEGRRILIDVTSLRAGRRLTIKRPAGGGWPKKLVLRVLTSSATSLDIQGRLRVFIPVRGDGSSRIDFPVPPEVYSDATLQFTVRLIM